MPDNAGPQRVAAFALIAGFIVCLILVVSLRKKPTIFVIYDVKGSIAAAIEHYPCAPEIRAECEAAARDKESQLRHDLPFEFVDSDCRNVRFIVDEGGAENPPATQALLAQATRTDYWTIRLHEGTLALFRGGGAKPVSEEVVPGKYLCQMVKHNGNIPIYE
jgi:hypothetical protein